MGLIDTVKLLDSADPGVRFKAVGDVARLGAAGALAVKKLIMLLQDLDGVNVPNPDGSEHMVTVAERAGQALVAIGEAAAGQVVEEFKRDNPISAIHCVRALASPVLSKKAPVQLISERLMRPKISATMATALCDVLVAVLKGPDETQAQYARSALKAAQAAGRLAAKHAGVLGSPAAAPAPSRAVPAAPGGQVDRPTSVTKAAPEPEISADVLQEVRGRVVERPVVPAEPPGPRPDPAETFRPEFLAERRIPPSRPEVPVSYDAGDRFGYREEVGRLLQSGEKLKAVNLLRAKTGASLVEALRQVERWA
jgi:hypothetical protein